jgi:hypothetical protein
MGRASSVYIGLSGLILAWHGGKRTRRFFSYPYTIVENAIIPFQGCFFTVCSLQITMEGTQVLQKDATSF